MQMFTLVLKRSEEIADRTRLFAFEKPLGFVFQAGQYVVLRIPQDRLVEADARGGVRSFSIASAPSDTDLCFVMREGESGFKKTLWNMPLGETIVSSAAVGRCTVPAEDMNPVVLVAGGVGITPARSILREAEKNGDSRPYYLFYSNRLLKDAAFHEELLAMTLPHFSYIWTLSLESSAPEKKGEERGYIDERMLRKYLPGVPAAHYYVIGAPAFTEAMCGVLVGMGVHKENINIDPFTGLGGPPVPKAVRKED